MDSLRRQRIGSQRGGRADFLLGWDLTGRDITLSGVMSFERGFRKSPGSHMLQEREVIFKNDDMVIVIRVPSLYKDYSDPPIRSQGPTKSS